MAEVVLVELGILLLDVQVILVLVIPEAGAVADLGAALHLVWLLVMVAVVVAESYSLRYPTASQPHLVQASAPEVVGLVAVTEYTVYMVALVLLHLHKFEIYLSVAR